MHAPPDAMGDQGEGEGQGQGQANSDSGEPSSSTERRSERAARSRFAGQWRV